MTQTDSPVVADIDYDAPGKRYGRLRIPRSTNDSGWASLIMPIVVVVHGTGPTALILGGNHGDEPVGIVAALDLARRVQVEEVNGRLIVIPCLSVEAAMANTRLWPSGANFNRSFPGSPTGPPDEQLADYLTRYLIPMSDIVVDMHSGGRSSMCLPWSEMHPVANPDQRRAMVEGMLAWNTDWHVIYIDVAGTGLLVGEAERQGKVVVSTELGGGGGVNRRLHELARSGLQNVLRHFGVLTGRVQTRESMGRQPATILRATDINDYPLAPESGLFETLVHLGDHVGAGQPLGQLHFLEHPARPPEVVTAPSSGVVCSIRAIAATQQGDNLFLIGHPITLKESLA